MKKIKRKSSTLTKALVSETFQLPQSCKLPVKQNHKTLSKSIRECKYRGKSIRIETTYKITIDKKAISTHTRVLDDGSVHCQDFPNYAFTSAIDMAKKIVDVDVGFIQPLNELGMNRGKGEK